MEGTLAWNDDKLMLRHIVKGEYAFEPLADGQELEVFQNGNWHRVRIQSIREEPYLVDWNYGDGVGCEARTLNP